jgi:tetratricopeptide (TPR) repeat protein
MSFRFWRRVRIAPGVTLNLSKRGASVSVGPRGAKLTAGTSGARATAGIPGSGLFYTKKLGGSGGGKRGEGVGEGEGGGRRTSRRPTRADAEAAARDRLDLGFFERLVTPKHEEWFVDAARAFVGGDHDAAYRHASRAERGADAAWLAGVLAMTRQDHAAAAGHFAEAWRRRATLGRMFERYGVSAVLDLAVTGNVRARVEPDERGLLLVRAELAQAAGDEAAAMRHVRALQERLPDDPVVRLSLAELLVGELMKPMTADPRHPLRVRLGARQQTACEEAVALAADVENASEVHAALLLHGAIALAALGLHTAARDRLTAVLRRRKDRSDELLREARFLRALVYEAMGRSSRARADLERIYAEAPRFPGVAARLGLGRGRG